MPDRPWWAHAIQWSVWFIAMSLLMGWLARTRARAPEKTVGDAVVLRYPRSLLVLGAVCSLFFFGCSIAAFITTKDGRGLFYLLAFNAFTLLGLPLIVDYYKERFEVGDERLVFRTTFGGAGATAWSDIVEVRYSQVAKWFRLRLRSGRVVRVSVMLVGLPVFAEKLLAGAPHAVISDEDRKLLRATAMGHPPSIWM